MPAPATTGKKTTAGAPACERWPISAQRHVLRRAREKFQLGSREPGLLYLGARVAASLGLVPEARAFLAPLADLLREDGRPSAAYFPVGLLSLRVLPPGQEREGVLADLLALAGSSPVLTSALQRLGLHPTRTSPRSPVRLLGMVERNDSGRGDRLHAHLTAPATPDPTAEATKAYAANDMPAARRWLERALLERGDRPEVLRNLITVTSELRDATANDHYWRRYVKVLLADAVGGEPAAWDELARFYAKVAGITDPPLAVHVLKASDALRRPGLLPRWLEAHAALAWLDPARPVPHLLDRTALAGCWLRTFYPEFAPYLLEVLSSGDGSAKIGRAKSTLSFDPGERLLTRLVQWARVGFGLKADDAPSSPHVQAVSALCELAVRVPVGPHLKAVRKVIDDAEETDPPPVLRAIQEAYSFPPRFASQACFAQKPPDWTGIVRAAHMGRNTAFLIPSARLMYALALAHTNSPKDALDQACRAAAGLLPEDAGKDSESVTLWWMTLQEAAGGLKKWPIADRRPVLEALRAKVEALPDGEQYQRDFRTQAMEQVETVEFVVLYKELLEAAAAALKKAMQTDDFGPARAAADALPDTPPLVKEQKDSVFLQIRVGEALKQMKQHCQVKNWAAAKKVLKALPDEPDFVKELKDNYLKQLDAAEAHAALNAKLDAVMAAVKTHCGASNWSAARAELNKLPNSFEVLEFKQNVREQIDANELMETTMAAVQAAVNSRNLYQARSIVDNLPNTPKAVAEFKANLQRQLRGF